MRCAVRQIAVAVGSVDRAAGELLAAFGLQVGYRDPRAFELRITNALLPIGTQFIELIEPYGEDAPVAHFTQRAGGDAGYAVILQCLEGHAELRSNAESLGFRPALEVQEDEEYEAVQFHPKDVGGTMLSVDRQRGDNAAGPWWPAGGEAWRSQSDASDHVGIVEVTVACADSALIAARWGALLAVNEVREDGDHILDLDGTSVRFREADVGSQRGLIGVTVATHDRTLASTDAQSIGGLRWSFTPVDD